MESYHTIQGEGYHAGKAAYFVRLAGCDVGCIWCDVKESWDAAKHPVADAGKIAEGATQYNSGIVVITGGEPLIYNLDDLCKAIHSKGLLTHLETSGAYPLSGEWDWICLSPKKFKAPLQKILNCADELKIIVYNKSDFLWAEKYAAKVTKNCKRFLQPEWDQRNKMLPLIIDYVKQNPEWEISLQIHKLINVP